MSPRTSRLPSDAASLAKLMSKMLKQRKKHLDIAALHTAKAAQITRIFSKFGITMDGTTGKERAAVAAIGPGRRGQFATTGEQSILAFVKQQGNPTTAEINKHWKAEHRGGKADNTITKLVKAGKLVRVRSKDVRGSRYTLA